MARTREIPADLEWFKAYLSKKGKDLTPEAAMDELDSAEWRRMQAAWRMYRSRQGQDDSGEISHTTLMRLEVIARRIAAGDVDRAVAKLYAVGGSIVGAIQEAER